MEKGNHGKEEKPAIGYLRVSTQDQGRSGIGLEGQRVAIEKFAELNGLTIQEWHQDVASGMGEDSAVKRDGLTKALGQARELRCPVFVNGLDRLSRHTRTIEEIVVEGDVDVISTDGGTLTPHAIRSRAARAEAEGRAISDATIRALRERKAAGVLLGNRTNLDQAQKAGAAANKDRWQAKVEEIADHLQACPRGDSLSAGEVVDRLNQAGIFSGSGRGWTTSGIRRPLAAARKLLQERKASNQALSANPNFGRFS